MFIKVYSAASIQASTEFIHEEPVMKLYIITIKRARCPTIGSFSMNRISNCPSPTGAILAGDVQSIMHIVYYKCENWLNNTVPEFLVVTPRYLQYYSASAIQVRAVLLRSSVYRRFTSKNISLKMRQYVCKRYVLSVDLYGSEVWRDMERESFFTFLSGLL